MSAPLLLDWVSPLPPVASGIADYSADLLPYLHERADLQVRTLEGENVDPGILRDFRCAPLGEGLSDRQRLPVYQMGNNQYHLQVWKAALERPGVVTLHDHVLHHFHLGRTFPESRFEDYLDQLRRDHGWLGEVIGRPRVRGIHGNAAMFELPMNRSLVRSQRGVLVHNSWVAERLREQDPELRVHEVPMAVPLPQPPQPEQVLEIRRRYGLDHASLVLGSFGFQTRIKRTHKVIEALASPELRGAHLLVAGQAESDLDIELEARRAGIGERVHRMGYLPFADFEAAIAACDVCLCLRYPSAGETSAALLRVLAVGRPALVSDYGQFAGLPDDVVVKIPLGEDEVSSLTATILALSADRDRLAERGQAARRYVADHHQPERAADAIVAACRELASAPPLGPAVDECARPTTLTWSQVAGAVEVSGAELPWHPGERRRLRIELTNRGDARWLAASQGPGGVLIGYEMWSEGRDLAAGERWLPLSRDLDPGDRCVVELALRRPPGPTELVIEPHVAGIAGFSALGGPVWRRAV